MRYVESTHQSSFDVKQLRSLGISGVGAIRVRQAHYLVRLSRKQEYTAGARSHEAHNGYPNFPLAPPCFTFPATLSHLL